MRSTHTSFNSDKNAFKEAFSGVGVFKSNAITLWLNAGGLSIPILMTIIFPDNVFTRSNAKFWIVHEFGHAFDFNRHNDWLGWSYFSHEFVVKINQNPKCTEGWMGCLPDKSFHQSSYDGLNFVRSGSDLEPSAKNNNTWMPTSDGLDYSYNSSIDAYANAFASLAVG